MITTGEQLSLSEINSEKQWSEEERQNAEIFQGNHTKDLYSLHYSASPVLGDDVPTEEECRQILLSMQRAMDREAPVLTSKYNKHRSPRKSARTDLRPTKPGLRIKIPAIRSRTATAVSQDSARSWLPSSVESETSQSRSMATALWKRRNAPGPTKLVSRDGWASSFNLKAKMSRFGLQGVRLTHKPQASSGSDVVCMLCRGSKPKTRGLCQSCEDDFRAPHDLFTKDEEWTSWLTPPPRLDHISFHQKPSSLTLPSQYSVSQLSLADSEAPIGSLAPPTPLSDMPTPLVESRLRGSGMLRSTVQKEEQKDLYDEAWAEYYFDEGNFLRPGDAASAADRFMQQGLKLEEYEAVFASPIVLSPDAGWI